MTRNFLTDYEKRATIGEMESRWKGLHYMHDATCAALTADEKEDIKKEMDSLKRRLNHLKSEWEWDEK